MNLSTKRLVLRPVVKADVSRFFDSGTRPGVALYAGFPTPKSLRDTRVYVRKAIADWKKPTPTHMLFSITLKSGDEWLGGIHLRWPHGGVAEVGYSIHPDHWGKGYAAEALRKIVDLSFRRCSAHRVQATTWVKNTRSQRVLAKAGLRREGLLRGFLKREGVVRDEFIYGLARADWKQTPSSCDS